jgi:hypothetical protein
MSCLPDIEVSHEANQVGMYCRKHSWYVLVPNHSTLAIVNQMAIQHGKQVTNEAG